MKALYFTLALLLPGLAAHAQVANPRWWNDAVFYEVFVRSFYDNNGDGKGDLAGLTSKLDYLNDGDSTTTTDLGVTALWLMPIMQSPSYHGYDVTNYKAVDNEYGTLAQFDTLIAQAHRRGIKVILDLVLNHTSNQHTWFTQSASGTTSPLRDWYVWSATDPNVTSPIGSDPWHSRGSQYYYGIFYDGMPDLNWRSADVKQAMWDASRFWLNRGVDGYRLDAVKYLVENGNQMQDVPETFQVIEEFEDTIQAVNPEVFTVGEAWSATNTVPPYVQDGRLSTAFEFDLATSILVSIINGNSSQLRQKLAQVVSLYPESRYGTFLTNHDQDRTGTVLGSMTPFMKQAAALYLTMPGTPFIYYGEELGQTGTGADENKRLPMQWTNGPAAGFTTGTPWRAPGAGYATNNVQSMAANPNSLLNYYKSLIRIRKSSEALRRGGIKLVAGGNSTIMSYLRNNGENNVLVVSNMGRTDFTPSLNITSASTLAPGTWYATDMLTGRYAGSFTADAQGIFSGFTPFSSTLAASQTLILNLTRTQPADVQPIVLAVHLSVSPNPASDRVLLALEGSNGKANLEVLSTDGRLVHTQTVEASETILSTESWPAGIYTIRLRNGSQVLAQRLSIVR